MRKSLVAGWVTAGVGLVLMGPTAAGSSNGGTYLAPFREDGATFSSATGAFSGGHYLSQATDANGCVTNAAAASPQGNPGGYRCLPAGATMLQLPDGRILFWDALEGTENVVLGASDAQGLPVSTIPDYGRLMVNDQARLLTLGPSGASFASPTPGDGGAHNTSHAEDLPLPPPLAATHYAYNNGSLFCSDQVFLGNGQVLDTGGTDWYSEPSIPGTDKGVAELEGIRNTRVFDPATDAWTQVAPMNHGRWYPSLVTLGSGRVFVASGVTKLIKPYYPSHPTDSATNVKPTETFDPTVQPAGRWTDNGTAAQRSLPLIPRLHLLPDGHVYYDAAGQAFNPFGYAYDEALWGIAASYDPGTKTWTDLGIPAMGSPFGGFRGSTFSAFLELRPDAAGTYRSASFLTAGGVLSPTPGSYVSVADSRIDTVSTAGGPGEALGSVPTGPLGRGRWYSTAIPLPDGTVYAVSGSDVDVVVLPGLESPIRRAELFTPTLDRSGAYTGGSWRDVGDQARKRTYHNDAILRPDGSVLIGGHAPVSLAYNQTMDAPDAPGRPGSNNHHDSSFQLWLPPYFHQSRPVVTGVSRASGGTIVVDTPDAASIASVVLIRNTAQTHLVDGDNRTVKLPVVSRNGGSVTVALPSSSNVLPNGPYLLFANRGAGGDPARDVPGQVVPSVGREVYVVGTSAPSLFPVPGAVSQTVSIVATTGRQDRGAAPHPVSGSTAGQEQFRGGSKPGPSSSGPAGSGQVALGQEQTVAGRAAVRSSAGASTTGPATVALVLLVLVCGLGARWWQRRVT
jgi:galactose oxidase-like protein